MKILFLVDSSWAFHLTSLGCRFSLFLALTCSWSLDPFMSQSVVNLNRVRCSECSDSNNMREDILNMWPKVPGMNTAHRFSAHFEEIIQYVSYASTAEPLVKHCLYKWLALLSCVMVLLRLQRLAPHANRPMLPPPLTWLPLHWPPELTLSLSSTRPTLDDGR